MKTHSEELIRISSGTDCCRHRGKIKYRSVVGACFFFMFAMTHPYVGSYRCRRGVAFTLSEAVQMQHRCSWDISVESSRVHTGSQCCSLHVDALYTGCIPPLSLSLSLSPFLGDADKCGC